MTGWGQKCGECAPIKQYLQLRSERLNSPTHLPPAGLINIEQPLVAPRIAARQARLHRAAQLPHQLLQDLPHASTIPRVERFNPKELMLSGRAARSGLRRISMAFSSLRWAYISSGSPNTAVKKRRSTAGLKGFPGGGRGILEPKNLDFSR